MNFPARELDVLRRCVRQRLSGGAPVAADAFAGLNWHHLLWTGRHQRALLFLRSILRQATTAPCPPAVLEQLDAFNAAARVQALARAAEMRKLNDAFDAAGLPFIPVDDWMFQQSFGDNDVFSETIDEIGCVLPAETFSRATEILAQIGHPLASARFQVAARAHTPVELLEATPAECAATDSHRIPVGGRSLRRLVSIDWLKHLARRNARLPTLDLLHAWQVVFLHQKTGRAQVAEDSLATAGIGRSYTALGLPPGPDFTTPTPIGIPEGHPGTTVLPVAPFVPTPAVVARRLLALAGTGPHDRVYDLGCGEGAMVLRAAAEFGAAAVGIDRDPALLATAQARAAADGVADRVRFIASDLFVADLSDATVICLYLLPAFYPRLREHLLRQARPDVRIVSHNYTFPNCAPDKTEILRSAAAEISQIYLYSLSSLAHPV